MKYVSIYIACWRPARLRVCGGTHGKQSNFTLLNRVPLPALQIPMVAQMSLHLLDLQFLSSEQNKGGSDLGC